MQSEALKATIEKEEEQESEANSTCGKQLLQRVIQVVNFTSCAGPPLKCSRAGTM